MKNFLANLFGSDLVEFDETTGQGKTPQSYTEVSNNAFLALIGVIIMLIVCELL